MLRYQPSFLLCLHPLIDGTRHFHPGSIGLAIFTRVPPPSRRELIVLYNTASDARILLAFSDCYGSFWSWVAADQHLGGVISPAHGEPLV